MSRRQYSATRRLLSAGLAAAIACGPVPAMACTGIRIVSADEAVIRARTMEFGIDTQSNVILVPRGYARTATAPDGAEGKTWTTKYAALGMNILNENVLIDGLNEKGLSVGAFYFPGYAGYQDYAASDAGKAVAPWELGTYILENFATVDEVRAGLQEIVVPATEYPAWKMVPPLHYIVMEPSGTALVIEYVDGTLNVHDNPIGVITNSPNFDWHMTNLNNYVNMTLQNVEPNTLGPLKVDGFGQGTGLLGIPGDFTPPSRFVRAAIFQYGVLKSETSDDAVLEAFHILNNFDIPRGVARDGEPDANGNITVDYTQWTAASDLENLRYYVRTYDNSAIRYVDLSAETLDAADIKVWPVGGDESVEPLAPAK
ncbi:choloylglycine hydrolase family protein [Acuticoccus sp. M5D2P5]|uniref:linear amide C-N hydrolase n=1 Tax=Acuticoccus kalidii TaxID=2910977 RepID=UPI001F2B459A|nr:choloylglycine hydrolase family protein [Acuticoccus kalidii]MCF3935264.1 choloylglycine hydrolase family protein [Acuticoccus kalidii]